jgi:hypothetical protein
MIVLFASSFSFAGIFYAKELLGEGAEIAILVTSGKHHHALSSSMRLVVRAMRRDMWTV